MQTLTNNKTSNTIKQKLRVNRVKEIEYGNPNKKIT